MILHHTLAIGTGSATKKTPTSVCGTSSYLAVGTNVVTLYDPATHLPLPTSTPSSSASTDTYSQILRIRVVTPGLIATCGSDGRLCVWSVTGSVAPVMEADLASGVLFDVVYIAGRLFVGAQDTRVLAVDFPTTTTTTTTTTPSPPTPSTPMHLMGHTGYVYALAGEAGALYSAGGDRSIREWDPVGLRSVGLFVGHTGSVTGLAVDDALLVSCSVDASVRLWSRSTRLCVRSLEATSPFTCLALSEDALYVGDEDGVVTVWAKGSFVVRRAPERAHSGPVTAISVVGSDRLYSSGEDGLVLTWVVSSSSALAASSASPPAKPTTHLPILISPPLAASDSLESGDSLIETLREFVRIPSETASRADCWRCAEFLRELLEGALGAECPRLVAGRDTNPVVVARLAGDPSRPTVVVYGHYDVVPVGSGWTTRDPFELTGKDGFLYGRGATDNKGPIVATVYALKELLEAHHRAAAGALTTAAAAAAASGSPLLRAASPASTVSLHPYNVIFLYEGEEERGSSGFEEAIARFVPPQWTSSGVSAVLVSNNYWLGDDHPCLTYGLRGVVKAVVTVEGGVKDVHSGVDGGAVVEPMVDLMRVLSALNRDSLGMEDVVPMAAAERALIESLPFSVPGYTKDFGCKVASEDPLEVLVARWCEPSVSIHSVSASSDEPGGGGGPHTVIPHRVSAKVSVRTVPNQTKDRVFTKLKHHLAATHARLHSPNTLTVTQGPDGDWWLCDRDSRAFSVAREAIREVWGVDPLPVREGGSMPVISVLEKRFGAPAIVIPLGQQSDAAHLPNERIRIKNLLYGKEVLKKVFERL
jgi:di- and tripeptidase